MSISYGYQKLREAVYALTGPSSQSDRLVAAMTPLFQLVPDDDIPAEIREDLKVLKERLSSVEPTGDEGAIKATVNQFGEVSLPNK